MPLWAQTLRTGQGRGRRGYTSLTVNPPFSSLCPPTLTQLVALSFHPPILSLWMKASCMCGVWGHVRQRQRERDKEGDRQWEEGESKKERERETAKWWVQVCRIRRDKDIVERHKPHWNGITPWRWRVSFLYTLLFTHSHAQHQSCGHTYMNTHKHTLFHADVSPKDIFFNGVHNQIASTLLISERRKTHML